MLESAMSTALATLGQQPNALLALSLRLFTFKTQSTDTFDGKPVLTFKSAVIVVKTHPLNSTERKAQELT
jgi:hypothetical protein